MLEPDFEVVPILIEDPRFCEISVRRRCDGRHVRLSNGRRTRAVGRYASVKVGASVPWESRLELQDMYRTEVDTEVVSYTAQPHTLTWRFEGEFQSYTPDRLERLASGATRIVEVKDIFEPADNPDYSRKLSRAELIYRQIGYSFALRQRHTIVAEPEFSAVEEVQAYRRTRVTLDQLDRVRRSLRDGELPLAEVLSAVASSQPRAVLFAMMVHRIVSIDLFDGLHDGALVTLPRADRQCAA